MPVAYNTRTVPLALNSANTAFSNNIKLAYDFTGHDAAHTAGVPWLFTGATNPTFTLTGTMPVSTVGGEPGAVAASNSLWAYNPTFANTADYGLQVGTGDFTIGVRMSTPATLPANANSREMFRLNGSAGTALLVSLVGNPSVGFYVVATGSTSCPLGSTNGTPTYFPADTVLMVWIRKTAGVTTIYTQNVTTQANTVVRYNAGASATTSFDSTWVASIRVNYSTTNVTGVAMQAFTFWDVGHSAATLNTLGKDFYDTQANSAVADSIAITSPTAGSSIASSSVISGTYVGTAPTGVQVQHGSAGWVTGTGMTIGSGAWSGSFALAAGASNTLQARESNATSVLSPTIANITVVADSITFTGNGLTTDEAVSYRTFQRNGSNQASVRVKFNYTGSPTGFEYSFDGGSWAALGGTPSGGAHNVVVTLTGPAQGALAVRFTNNTSVSASLSSVGVGDTFMVAGQSNHVGGGAGTYVPAESPVAHPGWKAPILDKTGVWRENVETSTDPFSKTTNASFNGAATATYAVQASSSTAYNSYFGRLATLFMAAGTPVAFVPSAMGSTSISSWAVSTNTATLYGAMLARANVLGISKVLWWQGEQDCLSGTTRASYEASLNAIINDWCVTRFPGAKWVLMNINVTGNAVGTGGTGDSDTGFNAIHAAIANVALTNPNVDSIADMNGSFTSSIHYATAPEITEIANRAYAAIASDTVGSNLVINYAIASLVYSDVAIAYSINQLVATDLSIAYSIDSSIDRVSNDFALEYTISNVVGANLLLSYTIASDTTFTRAPAGSGYRPRSYYGYQSRPPAIQGRS